MNKLRLAPEELRVESFGTTAAGADERGTVHGLATGGPGYTCYGRPTCVPIYTCPECASPPA